METAHKISALFTAYFGEKPAGVEWLPASGSARQYCRIFVHDKTYIGVWHGNLQENNLFVEFSRHFRKKGLHVPEVYCVSGDGQMYIQEDLGSVMLLDKVEQQTGGGGLNEPLLELYRKALSELLRFQWIGGEGLDYSRCIPRPVFDRQCILWDLNYFKYCFLRLAGADFSEQGLEQDFMALADVLEQSSPVYFMFRDFQSRNIMVREEEVWFIDYQGGRQGALQYDVASLLYDAIVQMPDKQREELLDFYIRELQQYRKTDPEMFRRLYYRFVLVRLLQAMGAFGLRGLYEKKQHFIDSIQPGLQTLVRLFDSGRLDNDYPEIRKVCQVCLKDRE